MIPEFIRLNDSAIHDETFYIRTSTIELVRADNKKEVFHIRLFGRLKPLTVPADVYNRLEILKLSYK